MQLGKNLNQVVRPTDVKTWLTAESMSPLGRELIEIANAIENSDEPAMDPEAIERELIKRRGGHSEDGE